MAEVAGDRESGLRGLPRPGAFLLAASLVVAAAAGAIANGGASRAVVVDAGGHPPPTLGRSPVLAPATLGSPPSAGIQQPAIAAASPVAGDAGQVSVATNGATAGAPPPPATRPTSSGAAELSRTSSSGPTVPPAPATPPQPPGLGARLLPGLPPVLPQPSRHPSNPPPSSGPTRYPSGSTGYDISWPQCGQSYPPEPYTVAIVGVNDGQAFSTNPCVGSEASWAGAGLNLYININSPTLVDSTDQSGPAGHCSPGGSACLAYNYGYNAAASSVATAGNQGVVATTWWLDVETAGSCTNQFPTNGTGYWSCNTSLNSTTIQGAIDALRHAGVVAGDYSTSYQWGVITGGYVPSGGSAPNWIAGADPSRTSSWCSGSHDFGGGHPWLLQLATSREYDQDQAC